jgi:hypothetical protein
VTPIKNYENIREKWNEQLCMVEHKIRLTNMLPGKCIFDVEPPLPPSSPKRKFWENKYIN